MRFSSRQDAGSQLGQRLLEDGMSADVVAGLPRGGLVVAAEVARVLGVPLEALVVRKIGHPRHREFALGALAEPGVTVLGEELVARSRVGQRELARVIEEEKRRLENYRAKFHPSGPPQLAGKRVLIVDDGLATGSTAEAAVLGAKQSAAVFVAVGVPVASREGMRRLASVADCVTALVEDPEFMAVAQYYRHFPQTSDEEVLALLPAHA